MKYIVYSFQKKGNDNRNDIKNGTSAQKMTCQKACRTRYVRVVEFVDGKERVKPEVYEGDLLHILD